MLTQEELKNYIKYDPKTGEITWNKKRNPNVKKGRVSEKVGTILPNGRLRIVIKGKPYKAEDLIWLYVHGRFPKKGHYVTPLGNNHINLRLGNMREYPEKLTYGNTTNRRGVYKNKNHFSARIRLQGRLTTIGTYLTAEEASAAYELAREALKKPA